MQVDLIWLVNEALPPLRELRLSLWTRIWIGDVFAESYAS